MKTSLILSASLLLFSTAAVANPVMIVQELRGQAIAGVHVKLTYTYNYGSTPTSATTHGTSQTPWVSAGSSSRDTGSGVKSLPILEMCDCHVPTSTTLDYGIVLGNGPTPSVTVQVQVPSQADFDKYPTLQDCIAPCQLADAADAGLPDGPLSVDTSPDTSPAARDSAVPVDTVLSTGGNMAIDAAVSTGGNIAVDAPVSTGGNMAIDAAVSTGGNIAVDAPVSTGGTTATGGASGTGGVIAVATVPSTGGTTAAGGAPGSAEPDKAKGGGCAFLAPGTSPALLCLALLGLAIAARRRRP